MRLGRTPRLALGLVLLGGIATLLVVAGCENGGAPVVSGKPSITSVSFPSEVVADRQPSPGTIGFSDPDGDVALVEFRCRGVSTGSFDPGVAGQASGSIGFTYWASSSGYYTVEITLRDVVGNSSMPRSFSYTAMPPPPIRMTAGALCSEFEENEVAGDLKYKGKLIAVAGYVESIDSSFGISVVLVDAPGDWSGVRCYFPESEAPNVANLRKGGYVTIVGECTGMLVSNVGLDHCRLE